MYFPSNKIPGTTVPSSEGTPDATISGRFDPSLLERGAKALKELDSSPNAPKAFELVKLQEQTRQRELQREIEQQQTQRQQFSLQRVQAEAEEKRRLYAEQQDQERRTAQYKSQLEQELYERKLSEQQKQNEEWLKKQHEQFVQHEQMRRSTDAFIEEERRKTLARQMEIQRETEVAKVKAETEGKIKQERENVDIHLREMRAKLGEERKTKLEQVELVLGSVGSGFKSLLGDKEKMTMLGLGLSGTALGVYAAKNSARVVGNLVEKALGKPSLVRETSRKPFFLNPIQKVVDLVKTKQQKNLLEKIVLEESLQERLNWTVNSLVNTKKHDAPFRHVLLHGPPGTGKTLFARTVAKESGLDYAVMTGGDVGPLGKDAVEELNKLFKWAEQSKKGLVLFIDEADAFLRQGRNVANSTMSEDVRNALSAFLHHTGTEQNKFMVILATNAREVMDRAVLDRVDESFEFPLPAFDERKQMIKLFVNEFLEGKVNFDRDTILADDFLETVSAKTAGLSGRQLSKLVLAWQSAVYGSQAEALSPALALSVLDWRLVHDYHHENAEEPETPEKPALKNGAGSH